MFLLMQYSAFDFRLLQSPHLLVPPIRSWPQVQANQEFINNFGLIRESYKSVLSPYLLPEDNIYVDCRKSLKFLDLDPQNDRIAMHVKMRRMVFDGRGGIKLLIGMVLDFGKENPYSDMEEALNYVLKKKVRISAPDQKSKEVSLANLSAPFKNLYAYSSSLSTGERTDMHLVKSQPLLMLLDMSQREFEHFQPQGKYESFSFLQELQLFYRRDEFGGKATPTFLTLNMHGAERNRLTKYYLSQLNAHVENMNSILTFYKRGEILSERAKNVFSYAYTTVFGENRPREWEEIFTMYQTLFPHQLRRIQQEDYEGLISQNEQDFSSGISSAHRESLQNLMDCIVDGHLAKTFSLVQDHIEIFDPEDQEGLLLLETRYNRVLRKEIEGIESFEDLNIEKNRISSALLKLFRSVLVQ